MTKKILVIDDDDTMCEIIDMLLTEEGYEVKTMPNGDDFHREIQSFNPDLLIVDYLMDGLSGAEIARRVRAREKTKNIPIIMIAADQRCRADGLKAGVNLFLHKPFDIYELLKYVNELLDSVNRNKIYQ